MSVTSASSSATWSADELIVETALGGIQYRLNSVSLTVNLAITGAGGMDTGSAPASGFVALYAIFNPTTQTAALLATNATSAKAPEVYGGSYLPVGYTASALVAVWPTDPSGRLKIGYLNGRRLNLQPVTLLTTGAIPSTPTALNISGFLPLNAKTLSGVVTQTILAGTGGMLTSLAANSVLNSHSFGGYLSVTGVGIFDTFDELAILTSQSIYYYGNISGSPTSYTVAIAGVGYTI
jgi:hypothetical protein